MKIGFIGTGIMGASMARNLLKAGHEVFVYNRTREKAERLRPDGAAVCGSVGECAAGRDAVITVVGFPDDVGDRAGGAGEGAVRAGRARHRRRHRRAGGHAVDYGRRRPRGFREMPAAV